MAECSGGLCRPNIFMFGLFPENASISERIVNRALIVHTTRYLISALTKIYINFDFRRVPKLSIGFKYLGREE